VSTQLRALVEHLTGRETDPASRPSGSRPARLFGFVGLDLERERRAPDEDLTAP
jgi:hypothetical protein